MKVETEEEKVRSPREEKDVEKKIKLEEDEYTWGSTRTDSMRR